MHRKKRTNTVHLFESSPESFLSVVCIYLSGNICFTKGDKKEGKLLKSFARRLFSFVGVWGLDLLSMGLLLLDQAKSNQKPRLPPLATPFPSFAVASELASLKQPVLGTLAAVSPLHARWLKAGRGKAAFCGGMADTESDGQWWGRR